MFGHVAGTYIYLPDCIFHPCLSSFSRLIVYANSYSLIVCRTQLEFRRLSDPDLNQSFKMYCSF